MAKLTIRGYIFVVDLQDCFFNWRVHPDDTWQLGFFSPHRRQFGKYEYLPFGLSIAPGVNDVSIKEILRLLSVHNEIDLFDFVDDLLGTASIAHQSAQGR